MSSSTLLEGDKRVVFVMAGLEDMTAAEISLAMKLSLNAVHARLRAACTDFERAAAVLRQRPPGSYGRTKLSRETEALLERGREGTPLTPAQRARLRAAILAKETGVALVRRAGPWTSLATKIVSANALVAAAGSAGAASPTTTPALTALSLNQGATIAATQGVQTPHLNEDNGS